MPSTTPNDYTRWLINQAQRATTVADLLPRMHNKAQEDNPELLQTVLENKSFTSEATSKGITVSQLIKTEADKLMREVDSDRNKVYYANNMPRTLDTQGNISIDIPNSKRSPEALLHNTKGALNKRYGKPHYQESDIEQTETKQKFSPLSAREKQIGRLYLLSDALSEHEIEVSGQKKHARDTSGEAVNNHVSKKLKTQDQPSPTSVIIQNRKDSFSEKISSDKDISRTKSITT